MSEFISATVSPFAFGPLAVVVIVAGRVVNFLPNTDPETKHNAAVMDPPRAGGVCRWKLRNFSLIATHGRVPSLTFSSQFKVPVTQTMRRFHVTQ